MDFKGNISSAVDAAKMSFKAFKNEKFRKVAIAKTYTANIFRNDNVIKWTWENLNKCLFNSENCLGIKTGRTPEAGACLSSYWRFPEQDLIIIVLNCATPEKRFEETQILAEHFQKIKFD